ncbi:MAG: AraC family transcriptional regulator [Acidobacteriota bacterium]
MGEITSLFVRKVAAQVDCDDDARSALLRALDLEPDGPVDPSRMVPDAAYYDFLEQAAAIDADGTTLPLRVGASMRCDEYGALGLAWKSAPDLRGSYERAVRYARVLTSVSTYTVEPTDDGARLHLHRDGVRRLGLRLSNEASLASIATISREASTAPLRLRAVHCRHPAPASTAAHEAFFGCSIHFDDVHDALHVTRASLDTPNHLGDAAIAGFFDHHLADAVAQLETAPALEEQVRTHIARALSEGVPTMSDVAKHLGMSGRTLQRRLADRGASFQTLVDEARRQLAERLLRQTGYSLAEVAFMTGFAEQSSFTRAFKRWAGQTPRSYRLQA